MNTLLEENPNLWIGIFCIHIEVKAHFSLCNKIFLDHLHLLVNILFIDVENSTVRWWKIAAENNFGSKIFRTKILGPNFKIFWPYIKLIFYRIDKKTWYQRKSKWRIFSQPGVLPVAPQAPKIESFATIVDGFLLKALYLYKVLHKIFQILHKVAVSRKKN